MLIKLQVAAMVDGAAMIGCGGRRSAGQAADGSVLLCGSNDGTALLSLNRVTREGQRVSLLYEVVRPVRSSVLHFPDWEAINERSPDGCGRLRSR